MFQTTNQHIKSRYINYNISLTWMGDFPASRGHDELGGPDRFVSGRLHLLHCSFFQHLIVKRSEDLWLWIWGSMDFRSMDLRWFEDLRFLQVAYSYKAPHTKHPKWAPTGNTWPLIKVSSGCYGYPPIKQSINVSKTGWSFPKSKLPCVSFLLEIWWVCENHWVIINDDAQVANQSESSSRLSQHKRTKWCSFLAYTSYTMDTLW